MGRDYPCFLEDQIIKSPGHFFNDIYCQLQYPAGTMVDHMVRQEDNDIFFAKKYDLYVLENKTTKILEEIIGIFKFQFEVIGNETVKNNIIENAFNETRDVDMVNDNFKDFCNPMVFYMIVNTNGKFIKHFSSYTPDNCNIEFDIDIIENGYLEKIFEMGMVANVKMSTHSSIPLYYMVTTTLDFDMMEFKEPILLRPTPMKFFGKTMFKSKEPFLINKENTRYIILKLFVNTPHLPGYTGDIMLFPCKLKQLTPEIPLVRDDDIFNFKIPPKFSIITCETI